MLVSKEIFEMTEAKLQASILRDLDKKKVFNFKAMSTNKRGIPDIILCANGRLIGLEIKKPTTAKTALARRANVSAMQLEQGERLTKNGGMCFFVDSFDDYSFVMEALNIQ